MKFDQDLFGDALPCEDLSLALLPSAHCQFLEEDGLRVAGLIAWSQYKLCPTLDWGRGRIISMVIFLKGWSMMGDQWCNVSDALQ